MTLLAFYVSLIEIVIAYSFLNNVIDKILPSQIGYILAKYMMQATTGKSNRFVLMSYVKQRSGTTIGNEWACFTVDRVLRMLPVFDSQVTLQTSGHTHGCG